MMVRHTAIGLVIYLALVLQLSLFSENAMTPFRPWLPGIALAMCIVMRNGSASLIWAAVIGLGVDCLSGDRLGVHVVAATLVAFSLMAIKSDRPKSGLISNGFFVFASTALWRSSATIAHAILDHQRLDLAEQLMRAVWDGLSTTGIAIGLYAFGRTLLDMVMPQRASSVSLANRWSMLTGG